MTDGFDAMLAQAEERLRQEQAVFKQRMEQDEQSFRQRQVIGWIVIALFVAICALCGYVIVNNSDFAEGTVTVATSALLVEALGLVGAMLKGTMGVAPKELEPVTARPELSAADLSLVTGDLPPRGLPAHEGTGHPVPPGTVAA